MEVAKLEYYEGKYFKYWQWFVINHYDELFDVVMAMMKDRIEELVPQLVKKYIDEIGIDIRTTLNGKFVSMDIIEDEIRKQIIKSLNKE